MTIYHGPDSDGAAIPHPPLASQSSTEDRLEFKLAEKQSQTNQGQPTNMDVNPMPAQHGQDAVSKSISSTMASFSASSSFQATRQQSSMPLTMDAMEPPTTSSTEKDHRARILEIDNPTQIATSLPSQEQNSDQLSGTLSSLHTLGNSKINRPLSPSNAPTMLMSSIVSSDGSVYAAVPMSSELYIIPKTSRGFLWNGDLFLKPYQRRSLGIDHLYSSGHNQPYPLGYSAGNHQEQQPFGGAPATASATPQAMTNRQGREGRDFHHRQDSSVSVHEIHLEENAGILPLWP